MPSVIDGSFEVGVSNPTLPANCRWTTAKPLARYSAIEGALASGVATAEPHHLWGRDPARWSTAPLRTYETTMLLELQCAPASALPTGKSGREPPHSHTTCTTQFRFLEWVASKIWSKQFASCIRDTDFIGIR